MARSQALQHAWQAFDSGDFLRQLEARVAVRSESQEAGRDDELRRYLTDFVIPDIEKLGFTWEIVDNPVDGFGPLLLAERIEAEAALTLLTYGHGDVVRGYDDQWREGLSPWRVVIAGPLTICQMWMGRS